MNNLLPNADSFLTAQPYNEEAVFAALDLWASATTSLSSPRRDDILRDKLRMVRDFFESTRKSPAMVTSHDVLNWQRRMIERDLASETVYGHISRLSSFYKWMQQHPQLAESIPINPVDLARPRRDAPYSSPKTQPWTTEQTKALLAHIREQAATGKLIAKRDYALMLMYMTTGLRRREIIQLRGADVQLAQDGLVLNVAMNGGARKTVGIDAPQLVTALQAYIEASGRTLPLDGDTPLWLAHDRAAGPRKENATLSSHGFVKNLKHYAEAAGLGEVHLQQTRHTFAALVSEEAESLTDVQEALHHERTTTTRAYLDRIVVKSGKFSRKIIKKLDLE
ncbi:MAG: tyrosine-type recombinase/integrase [Roseiflexaceae bacterium]|nr:tyrosine-type recombinase/integrase [Roseiflexaceae bacterium]